MRCELSKVSRAETTQKRWDAFKVTIEKSRQEISLRGFINTADGKVEMSCSSGSAFPSVHPRSFCPHVMIKHERYFPSQSEKIFTRLFHISKWQHSKRLGRIRRWKHCSYSAKFGSSREQRPWLMPTKAYIVELY